MKSCEVFNALPYRERAVEYARKAVELDPRNRDYKTNLANALFAYAQMHLLTESYSVADSIYRETADLQRDLLREDPDNQYLRERYLATILEMYAKSIFEGPDYDQGLRNKLQREILSEQNLVAAKTGRLENYRDYYLLFDSINRNDIARSETIIGELEVRHQAQSASPDRISLLMTISGLTRASLGSVQDPKRKLGLPNSLGSDCNSRLINWANAKLTGDDSLADLLLNESVKLGQKGMVMGLFASKLENYKPSPDSE